MTRIHLVVLALAASLASCGGSNEAPAPVSVGGTVTGLDTDGLVLVNDGELLNVSSGAATFLFPTKMLNGASFSVSVQHQPTTRDQTCAVSGGVGIASSVGPAVTVECHATRWLVTTVAGTGSVGSSDGPGPEATFNRPAFIAVNSAGESFVTDPGNLNIRKISVGGDVSTLAGSGASGHVDGVGSAAQLRGPQGIAVDVTSGALYFVDSQKIRRVSADGVVTTIAGADRSGALVDGLGAAAAFNGPNDLAVNAIGGLVVSDSYNGAIRQVTPGGLVTTLAGFGGYGYADGVGPAANFELPQALTLDKAGNAFVVDGSGIRKVTPAGAVSTFIVGPVFGLGGAPGYEGANGIAIDLDGNIFITDTFRIRKITSNGIITVIAGSGRPLSEGGIGVDASFFQPTGIAVDGSGLLYVVDGYRTIRKLSAS